MKDHDVEHRAHLPRLKRIEGQVRGVSKMVEEGKYCVDIVNQIKAVKSALSSLEGLIIEDHLNHCVQKAISGKDKKEATAMIDEIKDLLKRAR